MSKNSNYSDKSKYSNNNYIYIYIGFVVWA